MKKLLSIFVLLFGLTQVYGVIIEPLEVPAGLDDVDATDTSITLNWSPTADAIKYGIYRITKADPELIVYIDATTHTKTEEYNVSAIPEGGDPLTEFTSYDFAVSAVYASRELIESELSDPIDAKTTHTWDGELLNCLGSGVSAPPKRTELEFITLFNCTNKNLTTMAPTEDLSNIIYLNLYGNDIAGTIPSWITSRTTLKELGLAYNNLIGEIPAEIGNLDKLTSLTLYDNNLIGEIPAEIGNLFSLEILDLSYNSLTENIPVEICNDTNLTRLILYSNDLTGRIPSDIGKLVNLAQLELDDNDLTGTIPLGIDKLINLVELWLNNNNLIGEIPKGIEEFQDIDDLHLYNNCNLYTNEESLQAFIDATPSGDDYDYQYILDTNSHDCNTFNPAVIMYILD